MHELAGDDGHWAKLSHFLDIGRGKKNKFGGKYAIGNIFVACWSWPIYGAEYFDIR